MKKFTLNTLKFLLFTGLFYLGALFIYTNIAPFILKPNVNYMIGAHGHLHSRIAEIKNHRDVDILFLGSSHAYRGFDTRIFAEYGYKTFNLGSSAQSPIQTKVLLNRYFDDLNPKVVVYEVYPGTLETDGVESSLDIVSNDRNDFYSLEMVLKINNIKTYNTFLYGVSRDILGLNDSFVEAPIKGNNKYISGGFVENSIEFYSPTPFEKEKIKLNNYQLESFSEIVQILKKRKIELILVYAPITQVKYDSYSNTRYFDSLMSTFSVYYNFNDIVTLNDSLHFIDSHHLNQDGVENFNNKLVEVLKEDGVLRELK